MLIEGTAAAAETELEAGADDANKGKTPEASADQAAQLQTLTTQITDLTAKLKELEHERTGTVNDLREERRLRQQLEATVKKAEGEVEDLGLSTLKDEDYLTAGTFKKALTGLTKALAKSREQDSVARAEERMADDEARMTEKTSGKDAVPYDDALDEFKTLAKSDPSLWEDVQREARRPGGKPAEKAYKIALRESPKFRDLERKRAREDVVRQIDETGKLPTLKGGGGKAGDKDLTKLTDEEIAGLSDEELDALLKKTG